MLKGRHRIKQWGDLNMAELDLQKLITHFAQSNQAEGKSKKTSSWYTEMLNGFINFLSLIGRKLVLDEFNVSIVREFIIHEQERKLSPFTIQGKVRTLKVFASWLFSEGYTTYHILCNLKMPKAPKNLIEPLTDAEINQLLKFQNPLTSLGCRNIAILVLLLDIGLRVGELCRLRFNDVHIEEGYLKVMGKGSKERITPIGGLTQKMLWRYIIHFRPEITIDSDDFLFLTLDGRPLSTNAVKLLLKRWGRNAGVPRLHAHLCRHTFATNFLIHKCGDVFRLQQILGHNTLEMVRRYIHFASSKVMINGRTSTPMDRIGIKSLNGHKIDRMLKNNYKKSNNHSPNNSDPKGSNGRKHS